MNFSNPENNKDNHKSRTRKSGLFRGLGKTIILWFLGISIIPMTTLGIIGYQNSKSHLREAASDQLLAIVDIKKHWLEDYFAHRIADVEILAAQHQTRDVMLKLSM